MTSTPDPFGVRVRHHPRRIVRGSAALDTPDRVVPEHWDVDLPHQCDEWIIASGDKVDAVADLTRFIDELSAARTALLADELPFGKHPWE